MQGPDKQICKQDPLLLLVNPSAHLDSGRQLILNTPISAGAVLVLEMMAIAGRKAIV